MTKLICGAALGVAALSLGACATVTRGDSTAWEVRTSPPGASVKTTNNMQCDSTPCSLRMPRRSEFDATITKAGYKPLTVHVTHKISGAGGAGMAGNVLIGGIIGAGVDVATGAMYDLTPNPVDLALEKDDVPAAPLAAAPAAAPAVTPAPAATPAPASAPAAAPAPTPVASNDVSPAPAGAPGAAAK